MLYILQLNKVHVNLEFFGVGSLLQAFSPLSATVLVGGMHGKIVL
jgi:hypothetical protein